MEVGQQSTKSCRMGRFSVCLSVRPAINQRGLTAGQRGLTAGQKGLKNNWRGSRAIQRTEGKLEGSNDQPGESVDQSEGLEGQSEERGPVGGV